MKKRIVMIMALIIMVLVMVPAVATAETVLVSAPVKGGEGGVICSCTNLTKKPIDVRIHLYSTGGYWESSNITILSGYLGNYSNALMREPMVCRVLRDDGKSVSAKHLKCTMASIDALGNPMAVLPVDTKFKQ